jgi:DNA-binding NarL/FixJ family response regulator
MYCRWDLRSNAQAHCVAGGAPSVIARWPFMKQVRILLADDYAPTRESFEAILAPHFEIVATVANGRDLIEAALRLKPELIILDITMPLRNGIRAAREIRKNLPETKLLFVTMHTSSAYVKAAFKAGGTGYLVKSSAREEILAAAMKVLEGETYITPNLPSPPGS